MSCAGASNALLGMKAQQGFSQRELQSLTVVSMTKAFDGVLVRFRHCSQCLGNLDAHFQVFIPPMVCETIKLSDLSLLTLPSFTSAFSSEDRKWPVLFFLAGLTCDDSTAAVKSGLMKETSAVNMITVFPDTSPRDTGIVGESDTFDCGTGAGFYLDATKVPWNKYYRMNSYILQELVPLVDEILPVNTASRGISGHSMGGHGALTLGLKNPFVFKSVSAFAPICHPSTSEWGQNQFGTYLESQDEWAAYDTVELLRSGTLPPDALKKPILIDVGTADSYLPLLGIPDLEELVKFQNLPIQVRHQTAYGHGYHFVSTFVPDHVKHHAAILSS